MIEIILVEIDITKLCEEIGKFNFYLLQEHTTAIINALNG